MIFLIIGLTVFFTIHTLPWNPAMRETLLGGLGLTGYRILFAVGSAIGLVLTIFGYGISPKPLLWITPEIGPRIATFFMPLAFILIAAAYLGSNIKRVTAHPMLWGIAIWATVHLINNGDLPSVLLFGGFLLYSLGAMASANKRGAAPATETVPTLRDTVAVVVGMAAAFAVAYFHWVLFGAAAIPS